LTRDEVQTRSEGALQAAEGVLSRLTDALTAPDWLMRVRGQMVLPDRIDDAVAQVLRVDLAIGTELATRRNKVAELTRGRLRELGVEPTATRLDDLVSQLVARARVAEPRPPAPPRVALGLVLAASFAGLMFAWGREPLWLAIVASIALVAWVTLRR
jgi:hypothetical protein